MEGLKRPFKTLRERFCVTPKEDNILQMKSWGMTGSLHWILVTWSSHSSRTSKIQFIEKIWSFLLPSFMFFYTTMLHFLPILISFLMVPLGRILSPGVLHNCLLLGPTANGPLVLPSLRRLNMRRMMSSILLRTPPMLIIHILRLLLPFPTLRWHQLLFWMRYVSCEVTFVRLWIYRQHMSRGWLHSRRICTNRTLVLSHSQLVDSFSWVRFFLSWAYCKWG